MGQLSFPTWLILNTAIKINRRQMEQWTAFNIKKGDIKKIKNHIKREKFSYIAHICKIRSIKNTSG